MMGFNIILITILLPREGFLEAAEGNPAED
jgi:hypothetical protein